MGATGLNNVPINVPVHVACVSDDAKNPGKPAWSLTKPARLQGDAWRSRTPSRPSSRRMWPVYYAATCNLGGGGEVGGVQLHAGTLRRRDRRQVRHLPRATRSTEWAKTGHAKIFSDEIDNKRTPDVATHYTESCARCHTTGYYAAPYGVGIGGFKDADDQGQLDLPHLEADRCRRQGRRQQLRGCPAAVKNMANIQCEQCHGPARGSRQERRRDHGRQPG